jgi:hypothetical protein
MFQTGYLGTDGIFSPIPFHFCLPGAFAPEVRYSGRELEADPQNLP